MDEQHVGDPVEVRRNGALLGLVGLGAVALALAYGWRGLDGAPLALVVAVPLLLVGAVFVAAALDARSPVMVVDVHGFRYRDGRTWTGVPWSDVAAVSVRRHRRPWQDGEVDVDLHSGERFTTRVGLSTPVTPDVVARLRELADGRAVVAEVVPSTGGDAVPAVAGPALEVPEQAFERPDVDVYDQERDRPADEEAAEAEPEPVEDERPLRPAARIVASAATARRAIRANLVRNAPQTMGATALSHDHALDDDRDHAWLPEARHLDPRTDRPGLVLEPTPAVREPEPVEGPPPVVWTPDVPEVAVVGEQVAAARRRLGLSVDAMAERTRIRPHVIEAIEIDDFAPCGGDFYARGHLRSLARILGMDAAALVADYDAHYAQAPVGARTVFEAELATGPKPSIRLTTGGPNWGALLGVVMVLAIIWGLGHLLTDRGEEPADSVPVAPSAAATEPAVDPSSVAGLGAPTTNQLVLRGRGESTRVVVRDSEGQAVWVGRLADGDSAQVRLVGRGTITASDGGLIAARVNDRSIGRLGDPGERVERKIGKA
ncbi:helix-turn-helix domain-containing protein [Solicola sp. PLA-1-18]|uniref:helix-turn-helix domain-containing protein n=1 Tax=Solicola sp. PLA-1-18 TaxID=3380532 RepID=UPI003B7BD689